MLFKLGWHSALQLKLCIVFGELKEKREKRLMIDRCLLHNVQHNVYQIIKSTFMHTCWTVKHVCGLVWLLNFTSCYATKLHNSSMVADSNCYTAPLLYGMQRNSICPKPPFSGCLSQCTQCLPEWWCREWYQ